MTLPRDADAPSGSGASPTSAEGEARPTALRTENLAIVIWNRLAPKLTQAKLHRVRVYENHDLFVDFYGESS